MPGDDGDEPDDFQETDSDDDDNNDKKMRRIKRAMRAAEREKSVFRRLAERSGLIQKRAHNINADFNMAFSVPAGTTCTGEVEGQSNVCLVKIANKNDNGPFGGVVAIQMAASNGTAKVRSFRA